MHQITAPFTIALVLVERKECTTNIIIAVKNTIENMVEMMLRKYEFSEIACVTISLLNIPTRRVILHLIYDNVNKIVIIEVTN